MSTFAFVYYTSPKWSLLGCLIAGFGCYGLVGHTRRTDLAGKYEYLGQVTTAIALQIFIDCMHTLIFDDSPRTGVVTMTAKLAADNSTQKRSRQLLLCSRDLRQLLRY